MEINGVILFKEVQHFRVKWIWWLIIIITIASTGPLAWVALSEKDGSKSTWIGWITLVVSGLILAVLIWLFYIARFEKIITTQGVFYKWWPFQKKGFLIEADKIEKLEFRNAPFLSYGYHIIPGYGSVHNLNAGKGIHFILKNGKKIFLGTQQPEELRSALEKIIPSSFR